MDGATNSFRDSFQRKFQTCPDYSFLTTETGRIALIQDWDRLISEMETFPSLSIQATNARARLSVRICPTEIGGPVDLSPLHWTPGDGCRAWADMERCKSCGSPGNLRVLNSRGNEYLRFCAPAAIHLQSWAKFLAQFATHPKNSRAKEYESSTQQPCLLSDAKIVDMSLHDWILLLYHYGKFQNPLTVRLHTTGASLEHKFLFSRIECDDFALIARAANACFALTLEEISVFALVQRENDEWLLVVGPDDEIIAEFGPNDDATSRSMWQTALSKALSPYSC